MWQDKLNEIVKEKQIYKEKINVGALEEEIQLFKRCVIKELNVNLPVEYLNILKTVNGIEFNGFIFYGIDESILQRIPNQKINGLVENNKIWLENEWLQQNIFLGESNISWYVYHNEEKNIMNWIIHQGERLKNLVALKTYWKNH